MTRDKFLQELRIALQGRVPQKEVNEQLRYYENYIIEESRKGRTEAEVLAELGDPRLIAKTLIDTADGYGTEYRESAFTEDFKESRQGSKGFQADYSRERGWDIRYGITGRGICGNSYRTFVLQGLTILHGGILTMRALMYMLSCFRRTIIRF